ncbi:MAG TPA: radical SAM protein [bacterium]|nr:radical SAM protein [bacterium]
MNRVTFEITNRCNLHCRHCLRDDSERNRDFPIALAERILRQSKEAYGVQNAGITGGEPLLYPHLGRLLDLLAEHDYIFSLVTNGHLIPKRLGLLKRPDVKCRIEHVAVSLDGYEAELHDLIRGEGSFKKVMQAIVMLKGAGIPVVVKYTIGRHNLDSLEQAALSLSHLELKRIEFSLTLPTPDNVAAGLIPEPADYRRAESAVYRMASELKTPIAMNAGTYVKQSLYTCSSLTMMDLYVDVKGRLCVCCMLPGFRARSVKHPEPEVVADLNKMDLWDAQKKLINVISAFQKKRLGRIGKGDLGETDHFQCLACARYFKKMEWLDALPDNPWSRSGKKKGS